MKIFLILTILVSGFVSNAQAVEDDVSKLLYEYDKAAECEKKVREEGGLSCAEIDELEAAGQRASERNDVEANKYWMEQGKK